jgi:hypothetical protein
MTTAIRNRLIRHVLRRGASSAAWCAGALIVLTARGVGAQTASQAALPNSPALTYLGATAAKAAQPTSASAVAAALANGVNASGQAQSGLAVDFALWQPIQDLAWLASPDSKPLVTRDKYRDSWLAFVADNLQMSLGSLKAAGDTSNTNLALGLKTNLLDRGDQLRDASQMARYQAVDDSCVAATTKPGQLLDPAAITTCENRADAQLDTAWQKSHWNALALSVAGATGLTLRDSRFSDAVGNGGALWTTLALPIQSAAALLFQARGDLIRGGVAPDTLGVTGTVHLSVGASTVSGFAEWNGSRRNHGASTTSTGSAGVEVKVSSQLWLSAGLGSEYNAAVKADRAVGLFNLHWSAASQMAPAK